MINLVANILQYSDIPNKIKKEILKNSKDIYYELCVTTLDTLTGLDKYKNLTILNVSDMKLVSIPNIPTLKKSVKELNGGYIYDTKEKITDSGVKNSNVKLFEKGTILFSFKLSIGKTAIAGKALYTNEAIAGIVSKDESILNNKYLYHYLTINDFSNLGSGIIGNGSMNKTSLNLIEIPIPSLEVQQEIIDYCDQNDLLVKQLEKEIKNNKKQASMYLANIY
jgi:restriction endonuclease S subunit